MGTLYLPIKNSSRRPKPFKFFTILKYGHSHCFNAVHYVGDLVNFMEYILDKGSGKPIIGLCKVYFNIHGSFTSPFSP